MDKWYEFFLEIKLYATTIINVHLFDNAIMQYKVNKTI